MDIKITPSKLSGSIPAISSKSYAQRYLIAAALSDLPVTLHLNGLSNDIMATSGAISGLGAIVKITPKENHFTTITITPGLIQKSSELPVINCSESGTCARIILPIATALFNECTVSGEGSLVSRPFKTLCDVLETNGVIFESKTLPITFRRHLSPGTFKIAGNESSQYISGLLFALPILDNPSVIELTSPLESSGYVRMTLEVLKEFGVDISVDNEEKPTRFEINSPLPCHSPNEVTVEGDWSNAAFWLAAGIDVTGLNENSLQKDKAFLELKALTEVDISETPDLLPILAVSAACKASGTTTRFYNAARLKIKESNRLETVADMINSLGGSAEAKDDELIVHATGSLKGGTIDSHNDHRIVMSAAIASCFCEDSVTILNTEAVEKSYANFFEDFKSLGGKFDVIRNR